MLFSADASKISNESPDPDPSAHPKLAEEILLKTRSSCTAPALAAGHTAEQRRPHFVCFSPEEPRKELSRMPLLSGWPCSAPTPCGPEHLPPSVTPLPGRRADMHLNWERFAAEIVLVFHLLKKIFQCERLQLSGDLAWLAREVGCRYGLP